MTTTTHYLVWYDEHEQASGKGPVGLYRRVVEDDGTVVGEHGWSPDGWKQTSYWLGIRMRGHDEKHLVEVDEATAERAQAWFAWLPRDGKFVKDGVPLPPWPPQD